MTILAADVLLYIEEEKIMICPACCGENEMAYSALAHGFVCLDAACSFELEMEPVEAQEVLKGEEELVCC